MSQCTARNRSGSQCGLPAIPGATVCRMHGGSAPQVRQKARERILAAAEPALAEMIRLATKAKNESVRRQAAAYILDRAGLQGHDELEQADGGLPSIKVVFVKPGEVPET